MPNKRLLLGRHGATLVLPDIGDEQHVGAVGVELEPVRDVFAQAPTARRAESSRGT